MKTAFIALDFHLEHTKSSQFFIDIVRAHFDDVHIVKASEAWYDIPRLKPETIIIWQKIFSPKEIDSWRAKNVVFIPMYDACPHTIEFWASYKAYKIFCFCRALYEFLSENGFNAFYAQYYKKPCFPLEKEAQKNEANANGTESGGEYDQVDAQKCVINNADEATQNEGFIIEENELGTVPRGAQNGGGTNSGGASVFYWERSQKITWHTVKRLIESTQCRALHYHYSSNIGEKNAAKPDTADIADYNITFSDWFASNRDFESLLDATDVFIAPRESEGIGLSFIEALAHDCIVVAYNAPTMSEYITSGVDGYLFSENDDAKACAIDISGEALVRLKEVSRARAAQGYNNWQNAIPSIGEFIAKPLPLYRARASFFTVLFFRTKAEVRRLYKKLCARG